MLVPWGISFWFLFSQDGEEKTMTTVDSEKGKKSLQEFSSGIYPAFPYTTYFCHPVDGKKTTTEKSGKKEKEKGKKKKVKEEELEEEKEKEKGKEKKKKKGEKPGKALT